MGAIFYNSIAYHPFFDTLVDFYFQIKTILNTPNHEIMDLSPQLLSDHRRNHQRGLVGVGALDKSKKGHELGSSQGKTAVKKEKADEKHSGEKWAKEEGRVKVGSASKPRDERIALL